MIKLATFEKPTPANQPLRLRLKQYGDIVTLQVVDFQGNVEDQGNLLTISTDGTVKLHCDVNPNFGFVLDREGRLKAIKD